MTDYQQNILKELVKKYFEGGNSDTSRSTLKSKLEVIRDFVIENFPDGK